MYKNDQLLWSGISLIYFKFKGDIILIMRMITPLGLSRLLLLIYTNILYTSANKTKFLTPRSWKVEWYSVLRHYVHIQQWSQGCPFWNLLISVNWKEQEIQKAVPFTLLHQQYENYLFVVPEPCRAVFRFGGLQLFMHKMEDTVGCSRRLNLKIDSRNQQNHRKWLLERETTIITGRNLELNVGKGPGLLKIESHRLW